MTIHVTPIPKLLDLAAPAFTLGTANAAGSAATAVSSDSTLLAFDTTDPAAVAASAVVGSATVAARRDHVHPGTTGAGTVVDDAITRFNGTGGSSLQGYSSLSPTISDAGIISLTSGALKFPSTAIASSDANTLDDYEMGTFTPSWTGSSGGAPTYTATRNGNYVKIGDVVFFRADIVISSLNSLTAGNTVTLSGLPFAASGAITGVPGPYVYFSENLNITAGSSIGGYITGTTAVLYVWDVAAGQTAMTYTELSDDGRLIISGTYFA
tara:strand:+ start:325 stop:1128 length:804 start_codon:yes stop_codon:yes gene_type:complete